jgi:hypothetical protein
MNRNASKLHRILLKYKIKFRSFDLELRSPLQGRYAVAAPLGASTGQISSPSASSLQKTGEAFFTFLRGFTWIVTERRR